jgi:hypothetical protein
MLARTRMPPADTTLPGRRRPPREPWRCPDAGSGTRRQAVPPAPGWDEYRVIRARRFDELIPLLRIQVEAGSRRALAASLLILSGVLLAAALGWLASLLIVHPGPLAWLVRLGVLGLAAAALASDIVAILIALAAAAPIPWKSHEEDDLVPEGGFLDARTAAPAAGPIDNGRFTTQFLETSQQASRLALLGEVHRRLHARRRQERRLGMAAVFFAVAVLLFGVLALLTGLVLLL